MRDDRENIIVIKTFDFALRIIEFTEVLEAGRKYVMANQVLKSGTSIGANVKEAQNAESKADFIHKMKIAAKEADETQYWLMLCNRSRTYPSADDLLTDATEIMRILSKIIGTAKA